MCARGAAVTTRRPYLVGVEDNLGDRLVSDFARELERQERGKEGVGNKAAWLGGTDVVLVEVP